MLNVNHPEFTYRLHGLVDPQREHSAQIVDRRVRHHDPVWMGMTSAPDPKIRVLPRMLVAKVAEEKVALIHYVDLNEDCLRSSIDRDEDCLKSPIL